MQNNTACDESAFMAMTESAYKTSRQLFWMSFSGPEVDGLEDCFNYDSYIFITVITLMITFVLVQIIVLVNMLIAVMSKVQDDIVSSGSRDIGPRLTNLLFNKQQQKT